MGEERRVSACPTQFGAGDRRFKKDDRDKAEIRGGHTLLGLVSERWEKGESAAAIPKI
jgi:hypothetical protein